MTAPVYVDVSCFDALDPFARDVGPIEALKQDVYHWLVTDRGTLIADTDWGMGLESYLGKTIPPDLATEIQTAAPRVFADVISDARCTITPIANEVDAWRLDLALEVDGDWLPLALALTPSGVRRIEA